MNTFRIPRFTAEASMSSRRRATVYAAMINEGGINCSNCLGGECVELHCFENWTHGGGVGGHHSCRDEYGRNRSHGTRRTETVVRPPGGPENTYVTRQQCRNGAWVDVGF